MITHFVASTWRGPALVPSPSPTLALAIGLSLRDRYHYGWQKPQSAVFHHFRGSKTLAKAFLAEWDRNVELIHSYATAYCPGSCKGMISKWKLFHQSLSLVCSMACKAKWPQTIEQTSWQTLHVCLLQIHWATAFRHRKYYAGLQRSVYLVVLI